MFQLPILTPEQVDMIHRATLRILSETGIILSQPDVKKLLLDHGASIKQGRVLLPSELVDKCTSLIPTRVVLQGRDHLQAFELGTGRWFAHNVGGVPNVFEPEPMIHRPATRSDNIAATRLLDGLTNISSVTPLFTPQDVPADEMVLWMVYDTLANTTKPFRSPGLQSKREVSALAEMVRIVCPEGKISVGISPVSPLTFPDHIAEAILEVARQGLGLGPLPCPILGATAPMSIAGGLAQQNAEVLASVVIAQLAHPGLPIIYKGRLSVMDPHSGLSVWGNPEIGIISAATVEIGHYYGMPVDVYGFCTNSHILDVQNGYERAFNGLLPVMAGADEISGVGELEGGVSGSLTQVLIDHEILESIKRIQDGFQVDIDSLAVEIVARVMDNTRNFLAEKHTIKFLRKGEVLKTKYAIRDTWSQWEKKGKLSMAGFVGSYLDQFHIKHDIPDLEEQQLAEMRAVIRAYK